MFNKVDPRRNFPEMEKEVLEFWKENKVFEESMKDGEKPTFSFYDGPPFATGLPHYGHVVASLIKDVVPRYWTMKGKRVDRRWGWDCHGLPVENLIEKELGIANKQSIEDMGIDKFNEACCGSVLRYADEWKEFIPRVGRWVDMENDYKTMDWKYTESIWWVFSELYKKGLVYEGYKSMHMCPRCETTLANFEVTQGYKDITDLSATVKFKLKAGQKIGDFEIGENTFVLAWTTTPWTLPGNVALAVGKDINYLLIEDKWASGPQSVEPIILGGETKVGSVVMTRFYIIAQSAFEKFKNNFKNREPKIVKVVKGSDLVDLKYDPVFDYLKKIIENHVTPRVLKKQGSNISVDPFFSHNVDVYNKEELSKLNKETSKSLDEVFKFQYNAYKIYDADFVTTEEGTGVVHIAPAFGEDDMNLAREKNLPIVQHVTVNGRISQDLDYGSWDEGMTQEDIDNLEYLREIIKDKKGSESLGKWQGVEVKPKRNSRETDEKIVKWLEKTGHLFVKENYKHSYPHCWRCDTPLLNYASSSWFVEVTKIKDRLVANNQQVNWMPGYIKDGRFGKWLEDARDWAVSRSRFWGAALPIWRCEDCGEIEVIGSIDELIKKADSETIGGVTKDGKTFDLHKPYIDQVKFKCPKCGKPMEIVGDVFDCWFESGSMPYAQLHYPFENEDKFEKSFPADFIAEGIDQTRGWFYTLMVLSTALFDKPAFKNVIVNGIVLAEDGQKMSKSLKNYPDPRLMLEKYGADALRYYLLTSPVIRAENLRFSEKGVDEVLKRFVLTLWNTYSFLVMNVELNKISQAEILNFEKSENLLDKWILSELNLLVSEVDQEMQNYDLVKASRPLRDFVDKLSNWYLRRSRKRFASDDMRDKLAAYGTLHYVLVTFTKVMAPFMPFLAEEIFKNLSERKSVHLEAFPEVSVEGINDELSQQMDLVRNVVTLGLAVRAQNRLKVRMPLATLEIQKEGIEALNDELVEILKEELNVKEVKIVSAVEAREGWGLSPEGTIRVALDLRLTEDLEIEGISREIIRQIQSMRKNAGYLRDDLVNVKYELSEDAVKFRKMFEKFTEEIKSECLLKELAAEKEVMKEEFDGVDELEVDGEKIILVVKK
ncbi:MAG: isoleucine--tRNA ligase [Patescibacteria group bacterium]